MNPYNVLKVAVLAIVMMLFAGISQAAARRVGPVQVELVVAEEAIRPGVPFRAGLHIVPDPEWHVYWRNPGDAGLPPALTWSLPPGFVVSDIDWPAPDKIMSGPLAAYGYHGDALYPMTVTPPPDLSPGDIITLELEADWLVCKVECLPGSATLTLDIPVVASAPRPHPQWRILFDKADERIPRSLPAEWQLQASLDIRHIYLDLDSGRPLPASTDFAFFASEKAVIEHAAEQPVTVTGDMYRLQMNRSPYSQTLPDSLRGVLVASQGQITNYYIVAAAFGAAPGETVAAAGQATPGLWLALFFAFVGGLILNLMPCVLPVLSLKVLGLVEQANQCRRSAFSHGLAFTGGVIVTFWVIVGVMLILQAGGQRLGWGFQLQSPTFVMILAGFLFLFALSLFGVFDISFLAGSAGGLNKTRRTGPGSAFVSGVTATLLATPCTAPFMGAALGFSLTQPPVVSMLVYTMLGLGMAAPYLLLSAFPRLLAFVPRPGRWMETLRQALGFLLAATVIWLGWVLAGQAGATAVVVLMAVLFLISLAAWIYGRWGGVASTVSTRWVGRTAAALILFTALGVGGAGISAFAAAPAISTDTSGEGIAWQPFSTEKLARLRSEDRAVFIDFTAAWCLSCQVNERVAFSSDEVQRRFAELDIVPLKADWTQRSDEIAGALAGYGRNSVPLYVLYGPGDSAPTLLPEILTPGLVLTALERIDDTATSD